MSNRNVIAAVLFALLAVGVAAGIGAGAYNAGVAHGLAESGRFVATPGAAIPYPYTYGWRPWGFGFGVFPFFSVIAFLFLARACMWRGRRGWRRCGYDGVPPAFEEWHRRAHQTANPPSPAN